MATRLPITAHLDGRPVSRDEVLAWERGRAGKVADALDVAGTGELS